MSKICNFNEKIHQNDLSIHNFETEIHQKDFAAFLKIRLFAWHFGVVLSFSSML